jgi:hypothetical protein
MRPFRVSVTGVRHFRDYARLRASLDHLLQHCLPDVVIFSRCGRGTDALATSYAVERSLTLIPTHSTSSATAPTSWPRSAATPLSAPRPTSRSWCGTGSTATSATCWGGVSERASRCGCSSLDYRGRRRPTVPTLPAVRAMPNAGPARPTDARRPAPAWGATRAWRRL